MFGDLPTLASTVRLVLIIVAITQALLAARVVLVRGYRALVDRNSLSPERVPTAAMVAHGISCAYIAYVLLRRLPQGFPLDPVLIAFFAAILAAGAWAYTQIVVLTRRERGASRSGRAARRRGRSQQ